MLHSALRIKHRILRNSTGNRSRLLSAALSSHVRDTNETTDKRVASKQSGDDDELLVPELRIGHSLRIGRLVPQLAQNYVAHEPDALHAQHAAAQHSQEPSAVAITAPLRSCFSPATDKEPEHAAPITHLPVRRQAASRSLKVLSGNAQKDRRNQTRALVNRFDEIFNIPAPNSPWQATVAYADAEAVAGEFLASDHVISHLDYIAARTVPVDGESPSERHEAIAAMHDGDHCPPARLCPYTVPEKPADLVQCLLRLQKAQANLSRLLVFHRYYSGLQSTESYNLLIALSIRHTSYSRAKYLLQRMADSGIATDINTQKLSARLTVRCGHGLPLWHRIRKLITTRGEYPAWQVWLELLGGEQSTAFRQRLWDPQAKCFRLVGPAKNVIQHTHSSIPEAAMLEILSMGPSVLPAEVARLPYTAVYRIVLVMLRFGRVEAAMLLTTNWIRSLPPRLEAFRAAKATAIINLHVVHAPTTTNSHFRVRQSIESLISLHTDLRPDSSTLFHLLRSLRRHKGRSFAASQLVHGFARRWGTRVVDSRVRRRVAALALEELRWHMAKAGFNRNKAGKHYRRALHVVREFVAYQWRTEFHEERAKREAAVAGSPVRAPPGQLRREPLNRLTPGVEKDRRLWKQFRGSFRKTLHTHRNVMKRNKD